MTYRIRTREIIKRRPLDYQSLSHYGNKDWFKSKNMVEAERTRAETEAEVAKVNEVAEVN